jgi:hypothetical protein
MAPNRPHFWRLDENHIPHPLPEEDRGSRFGECDRRVALTQLPGASVSTVFLEIDHNFSPEGPPILFETMVFGGPLDGEQERYVTWDEAVEGHKAMVKRVEEAERDEPLFKG